MPDNTWFRIGHTTHTEAQTGCTAIVFDQQVPAAVDVRGGGPGTRETTLLHPGSIGLLDAIVLSGGSAFGLQAADGVMSYLAERGRGHQTRAGVIPLVASAIIYDLTVGEARPPTREDGYAAAESASAGPHDSGRLGAGTGATVAKLTGYPVPAGIGIASVESNGVTATAVVVLNAVGDVRDQETGEWLAVCRGIAGRDFAIRGQAEGQPLENTTIGAVLIDGALDRRTLQRVCISAQAALARCTVPAHTHLDGDTFFAASSRAGQPDTQQMLAVTSLAEVAVERAIAAIFHR